VHLVSVIVDIRALGYAVEVAEAEGRGESVKGAVDMGYGEDAGRVVELGRWGG
jgi:hypothetical protein